MDMINALEAVNAIRSTVDESELGQFDRELLAHQLERLGAGVTSIAMQETAVPKAQAAPDLQPKQISYPLLAPSSLSLNKNQKMLVECLLEEHLTGKINPQLLSSLEVADRLGLIEKIPKREGEPDVEYRLRIAGIVDARISRLMNRIREITGRTVESRQDAIAAALKEGLIVVTDAPQV
jgi:transcriptional regulator with XRE-family HTH domain